MHTRWTPVTIPAVAPKPDKPEPAPLNLHFTPQERDAIALHKVALEKNKRDLNRRDDSRDLAVVLNSGGDA